MTHSLRVQGLPVLSLNLLAQKARVPHSFSVSPLPKADTPKRSIPPPHAHQAWLSKAQQGEEGGCKKFLRACRSSSLEPKWRPVSWSCKWEKACSCLPTCACAKTGTCAMSAGSASMYLIATRVQATLTQVSSMHARHTQVHSSKKLSLHLQVHVCDR